MTSAQILRKGSCPHCGSSRLVFRHKTKFTVCCPPCGRFWRYKRSKHEVQAEANRQTTGGPAV
jgi:uncharacterized Zn finger protein (UPF0148 family)